MRCYRQRTDLSEKQILLGEQEVVQEYQLCISFVSAHFTQEKEELLDEALPRCSQYSTYQWVDRMESQR